MTKKIIGLAIVIAILLNGALVAQRVPGRTSTSPNSSATDDNYTHVVAASYDGTTGTPATQIFVIPNGMTQHQLTWSTPPTVTGLTITFSGSVGGNFTQIGTSTALNGTITGTGTYTQIKVAYTNYVGSGFVNSDYFGATSIVPSPSNSQAITLPLDTPCYVQGGTGTLNNTTNHANCKASSAVFKGVRATNTTGSDAYVRLYNLATDVTCSSATGFVETIAIGTGGTMNVDLLSNFAYSTGLAYCVTGGGSSTDNTPPPAGVYITLAYD